MKKRMRNVLTLLGMWLLIVLGIAVSFLIELLNVIFSGLSRLCRRK